MEGKSENTELYKQYEVLACTGEWVFTGVYKCDFEQRLIDALNEGVRTGSSLRVVDFLPLTDATMKNVKGDEKKFNQVYVAKNNIIFVAQITGKNKEKPLSTYPFRIKVPVGVMIYAAQAYVAEVYAAPYIISGQIYIDTWGQVADTIETDSKFLPLTRVLIDPVPTGGISQYDFVAINKERILSICENTDR